MRVLSVCVCVCARARVFVPEPLSLPLSLPLPLSLSVCACMRNIQVSAAVGVAVGVASVVMVSAIVIEGLRRLAHRRKLAKESTYLYLRWLDAKKTFVMDGMQGTGFSVSEWCEEYGLQYLDFDPDSYIDDLCVKLFYNDEFPAALAAQVDLR